MPTTGIIRSIGDFTAEVTIKESSHDEQTITTHPVELGAKITDHAFAEPAQLTVQVGWSPAYLAGTGGSDNSSGILSDISSALDRFSSILSAVIGTSATKTLSDSLNTASAVASGNSTQAVDALYSQASALAGQYNIPGVSTALSAAYQAIRANSSSSGSGSDSQALLTDLYAKLRDLKNSSTLIEVQTGKRLYQNMLIRSLMTETDQTTENVLLITIQLQEVFLVETLLTTMPPASNRADPKSASGVTNTGTKSVVPFASRTLTNV